MASKKKTTRKKTNGKRDVAGHAALRAAFGEWAYGAMARHPGQAWPRHVTEILAATIRLSAHADDPQQRAELARLAKLARQSTPVREMGEVKGLRTTWPDIIEWLEPIVASPASNREDIAPEAIALQLHGSSLCEQPPSLEAAADAIRRVL